MRHLWAIGLVLAVTIGGLPAGAEVVLFNGKPVASSGLVIGGWGSGQAQESSDRVYTESRSIKITSQGLHEGGRIDFKTPVEIIEPTAGEDTDYLQLALGFTSIVAIGTSTFSGPGFGASSVPGATSASAVADYYYDENPTKPKVNSVRVVLKSEDGRSVEATGQPPARADDDWYKFAIPFRALGLKTGESFKVVRLAIFTDIPETLYVGEISTVRDSTPITVTAGDNQVVAVNDTVTFRAEADAGVSQVRFSWSFGDRGEDGEDAVGEVVSHVYRKGTGTTPEGADIPYIVKLTATDVWGIKNPATATVEVVVNE